MLVHPLSRLYLESDIPWLGHKSDQKKILCADMTKDKHKVILEQRTLE